MKTRVEQLRSDLESIDKCVEPLTRARELLRSQLEQALAEELGVSVGDIVVATGRHYAGQEFKVHSFTMYKTTNLYLRGHWRKRNGEWSVDWRGIGDQWAKKK